MPASPPAPTALVLAGGAGTRLREVVADRPKPLADVAGRPFLDRVLDQLAAAGVARAVLCTGHLGEQIERRYGSSHAGMEIAHSREPAPLGTGGAARRALACTGAEHVLVLNGDSYCAVDPVAFAAWAAGCGAAAALVAVEVDDRSRFGGLEIDACGRVLAFAEKRPGAGPGEVHAGICRLQRAALLELPPDGPSSLERDLLPRLAARGELRAFRVAAPFLDIGTPASYAAAAGFFAGLAATGRGGGAAPDLLVLDRDGTLIAERGHLGDPAGVELLPGAVEGLRRFAGAGWQLVVASNQSGVGRGWFDERQLAAVNGELRARLAAAGIVLRGLHCCPHRPDEGCGCRKPAPGLLVRALRELGLRPRRCVVVGDKACDVELGRRAGARSVLVRTGYGAATERAGLCRPDLVVDDLAALADSELGPVREKAEVRA